MALQQSGVIDSCEEKRSGKLAFRQGSIDSSTILSRTRFLPVSLPCSSFFIPRSQDAPSKAANPLFTSALWQHPSEKPGVLADWTSSGHVSTSKLIRGPEDGLCQPVTSEPQALALEPQGAVGSLGPEV